MQRSPEGNGEESDKVLNQEQTGHMERSESEVRPGREVHREVREYGSGRGRPALIGAKDERK